jgi:threonine-phosphate decarboxylase
MKHGANIYKYAKKSSIAPDEIIDFSSNINSYHPKIELSPTNNMLVKYADNSYNDLKKAIATKYEIKKSQISLYNGATSAIFELFKSLKQRRVYLYAPLYGEYEKAITKHKTIIKVNRFNNIYEKPKKGSIVVFVNPSTPDAKFYKLDKLFEIWKKQNCTIILDESFLEFKNLPSFRDKINSYKKLYIVQSFSKFYSCAGVRIGAIFSNKQNIKKLKTPMWNLSSFDVEFLTSRLLDSAFDKKSKKLHKKNKKELLGILKSSKLFTKIYKSDSNFFLVKSKHADKIFKHLLKHKILVRTCGSFDFLSDDYLRFAVKDSYSHHKLIESFNDILSY